MQNSVMHNTMRISIMQNTTLNTMLSTKHNTKHIFLQLRLHEKCEIVFIGELLGCSRTFKSKFNITVNSEVFILTLQISYVMWAENLNLTFDKVFVAIDNLSKFKL